MPSIDTYFTLEQVQIINNINTYKSTLNFLTFTCPFHTNLVADLLSFSFSILGVSGTKNVHKYSYIDFGILFCIVRYDYLITNTFEELIMQILMRTFHTV